MKLVLLFLLCFIGLQSFAQKWCEPGAEWVYFSGYYFDDLYTKLRYEKDTSINQVPCKKISQYIIAYNYINGDPPKISKYYSNSIYTYASNHTVYIFNKGKFESVYLFNAQVDDTLKFGNIKCDKSKKIQLVDTKGFEVINDDTLRYYKVKLINDAPNDYNPNPLKIYERIGLTSTFIYPHFTCATDSENWSLQCYHDNEIGEYKTNPSSKCWEVTRVNENEIFDLIISPNPVIDNLNISSVSNSQIESVSIFDLNGKLIKNLLRNKELNLSNIDVSSLTNGLYFIHFQTLDGKRYIRKFIK